MYKNYIKIANKWMRVAAMQWKCNFYGITCSTDSSRVLQDCSVASALKKSGAREPYWRDNVEWWKDHLANIDRSPYYQRPSESLEMGRLTRFSLPELTVFVAKLSDKG